MTKPPIRNIVFTQEKLQERIKILGEQISRDYEGKELILVSILNGSLYFTADLSRAIDIPLQLDFMAIGVRNNANGSPIVRIEKDLRVDISGKHVLLIEDIIRTGLTTAYLIKELSVRQPADIQVCSLLVNPSQQLISLPMPYVGFEVSAAYLIGYGLDAQENWRQLPYIAEYDA